MSNFNPYKVVTDGSAGSDAMHGENLARLQSTAPAILTRGVVIEVFHDSEMLTLEMRQNLKKTLQGRIQNINALNGLRRNCLLVRELSQMHAGSLILCLPMFDPYISMPFKPGEIVFIVREDQAGASDEIPYVLCRVPTYHHVDDVNYTHDDRKFLQPDLLRDAVDIAGILPEEIENDTQANARNSIENFDNGGPGNNSFTFGNKKQAYDQVWSKSMAAKSCVLEPVPRFTKLPGDQTIQGSNNNLINFTIDRQNLSLDEALRPQRGAIDIVVGRGYTPAYNFNPSTAPNVVLNTRNAAEVDKTPHFRNKKDVVSEGDPDFTNDPSRIYVAMKTDIDRRFQIDISNLDEPSIAQQTSDIEQEKPGIALKTNQLRLLAREDIKISAGGNQGSAIVLRTEQLRLLGPQDIRIQAGDGNGAAIVLNANGNITLEPGPSGNIVLNNANNPVSVINDTITLGADAERGIARQDDTIAPNDAMIQWATQVTTALTQITTAINSLLPASVTPITAQPPTTEIGTISSASEIVKSV